MTQPIASFSGIASGIQWRDMVDQIIAAERRPVARLESQLQLIQRRVASWRSVQTSVTALRDALKPVADGSAFERYATTLTGMAAGEAPPVAVSASGTAGTGSFRLQVESVAQRAKIGSAEFESRTEPLELEGSFTLNGREISIAEGDSLNDVAATINAANRGTDASGVSASIIRTPDGDHRLVLTADRTGASGIELGEGAEILAELGLSTDPESETGSVIVAGRDATLRIDGALYQSASNTFEGIVDGVTFTLLRESASTLNANIGRDTAATRAAVKAIADSFNALAEVMRQQSNRAAGAALAGSATLRSMQTTLRNELDQQLEAAAGQLARLGDIGIQIDRQGRYTFDAKVFDERFAAEPAAVAELAKTIATATQKAADNILTGKGGSIPDIIGELESGTPRLNARIENLEDRLDKRREDMYRRFTRMEQALSKAQTQSQWLASQLAQFEPARR